MQARFTLPFAVLVLAGLFAPPLQAQIPTTSLPQYSFSTGMSGATCVAWVGRDRLLVGGLDSVPRLIVLPPSLSQTQPPSIESLFVDLSHHASVSARAATVLTVAVAPRSVACRFLTAGSDQRVRVWDLESRPEFRADLAKPVAALALHPSADQLGAVTRDAFQRWTLRPDSWVPAAPVPITQGTPVSLAWVATMTYDALAAGCNQGSLAISMNNGPSQNVATPCDENVLVVGGSTLASLGGDGVVRGWDCSVVQPNLVAPLPKGHKYALSGDGNVLIAAAHGYATRWTVQDFDQRDSQGINISATSRPRAVAVDQDGSRFAVVVDDTLEYVSVAANGTMTKFSETLPTTLGVITRVALSADGETVAVSNDHQIFAGSVAGTNITFEFVGNACVGGAGNASSHRVTSIEFAGDTGVLVAASSDGHIKFWHATNHDLLNSYDHTHDPARGITCAHVTSHPGTNPDEYELLLVSEGTLPSQSQVVQFIATIRPDEVEIGAVLPGTFDIAGGVSSARSVPGGELLVTLGADQRSRVWMLVNGRFELAQLAPAPITNDPLIPLGEAWILSDKTTVLSAIECERVSAWRLAATDQIIRLAARDDFEAFRPLALRLDATQGQAALARKDDSSIEYFAFTPGTPGNTTRSVLPGAGSDVVAAHLFEDPGATPGTGQYLLATGDRDGRVRCWSPASASLEAVVELGEPIITLTSNPRDGVILTGLAGGSCAVIDVSLPAPERVLGRFFQSSEFSPPTPGGLQALVLMPNLRTVLAGFNSGRIYQRAIGPVSVFGRPDDDLGPDSTGANAEQYHWGPIYDARWNQTGDRIVTVSADGCVRSWDTTNWTIDQRTTYLRQPPPMVQSYRLPRPDEFVPAVNAIDATRANNVLDGLLVGSHNGALWEGGSATDLQPSEATMNEPDSLLTVSHGGTTAGLAAGSLKGWLYLWDATNPSTAPRDHFSILDPYVSNRVRSPIVGVAWHEQGAVIRLAAVNKTGDLSIYRRSSLGGMVSEAKVQLAVPRNTEFHFTGLAWCPDGRYLAIPAIARVGSATAAAQFPTCWIVDTQISP